VASLHRNPLANSTAAEVVMATYRVELVQSIVETAIVFVEATNEQQAEELALELAVTGEPVDAEWRFKDMLGDIEILSVQQITRESK
jgi:hypothetical protein